MNTLKKHTLTSLFVLAFCIFTVPLKSQLQKDLPELVSQSAVIVRARVTALSAQWITDRHGKHIYTTVQLEPITALKGTGSSSLTYIGGTVNGITEVVGDVFVLALHEEVFFFLPARVEKFTAGKITVLSVQEGVIRMDDAVITASAVESAIRAMMKTPSLKMKFKDLCKHESDPARIVPVQNKWKKLGKAASLPDLVPYAVWNSNTYPIVVRKTPATGPPSSSETDSAPLNDNDSTLISFCVANFGTDATGTFSVKVYCDAQLLWTENISGLSGGFYTYPLNRYVASIPSGTHTLSLIIDPDHAVTESDITNNTYSRSITVTHAAGVPYISSILPSTVSAGTSTSVSITGTGFGATQGTGVVEFFYQAGQPKILGTVSNWSDTQIDCIVPIGYINDYPASAGSGPVTVRTASGVSGGYDVSVTFAYGGIKWSSSPVTYRINENYAGLTGEGAAVQAGFSTWNTGGANFSFLYGGATSITSSSYDGTNAILWGTTSGSLATNYYWYSGSTLLESDIVFDNTWTWGIGSGYDIQSIATHELGHSLNLRDQYGNGDLSEIMYGFGDSGEIKRTLTTADKTGIQWIYGISGLRVKIMVFLEGPLSGTTMTTTLATSLYIPTAQPYTAAPFSYSGAEAVSGTSFFTTNTVVDWVLVQLRNTTTNVVETRAGLLKSDGTVIDVDATEGLLFTVATAGDYYIVVRHRNHLGIMSAAVVTLPNVAAYDFTTAQTQAYGASPMQLIGTVYGMYTGEAYDNVTVFSDGALNTNDFDVWLPKAKTGATGYHVTDWNMDGQNLTDDFDLWLPSAKKNATSRVP